MFRSFRLPESVVGSPTEDNGAAHIGEHNVVVWNRVNFNPLAASRSATGMRHGPPNALYAPNPTSSSRIT